MNVWLLVVLAAVVTYASRATAMLLPELPDGQARTIVARVPPPLFAGLAVATLLDAQRAPTVPMLCAAVAALLVAPRRSLGLTLLAGLAGYAIGTLP